MLLWGTVLMTAVLVALGLRRRVGGGRALAVGLAVAMVGTSAVGIVLMDLKVLRPGPLLAGLGLVLLVAAVLVGLLRRRWPSVDDRTLGRAERWGGAALLLVLTVGTALRWDPSPYLHGGQDQGIYVNVGHNIARTGRLRPVDRMMAGQIRGVSAQQVRDAHRIEPVEEGSPLEGVREGRWIAGLHVEDASEGRLMPGFFHLLPVWFAMTEHALGFSRSTDVLVLLALLSQLAAFAVGYRLAAGAEPGPAGRRRGWAVGLMAAAGLALHPLDLWISTFTVSENLSRACLLGAAALGLEGAAAERRGDPGAVLMSVLAGLCFGAGIFTRGSMLALGIALALALVVLPSDTPRSRRALLWALMISGTAAACQAIAHSWPYFFSAASNHFHVPRIRPFIGEAVAWAIAAGASVLVVDGLLVWGRRRVRWLEPPLWLVRVGAGVVLLLAAAAFIYRATDATDAYGPSQVVIAVLWRYCGPVGLVLGALGLVLSPWQVDRWRQPWVLLAAVVVLVAGLKEGVRYDFYYARYLVADALPVLVIAGAWGLGAFAGVLAGRVNVRVVAVGLGVGLLAWHGHALRLLPTPVYWTRDLSHAPEDLHDLMSQIPDGAVVFFDARAPGRWRGILATPALLSFDRNVWVYPSNRLVERAVSAGTPVYMISGGWEAADHQRWPSRGPWHTTVVARGYYRAQRAEVVEGAMPQSLTEWGGPWELHRIDRSIWRGHGAFSVYPGSRFIASEDDLGLRTTEIPLKWQPGAGVELHTKGTALEGCEPQVELVGAERHLLPAPIAPKKNVRVFAMPPPKSEDPWPAAVHVRWGCPTPRPMPWTRLSLRWPRR